MNQQEFFIKYNHQPLDADGNQTYECVDVIKAYFKEVLGLPPIKGNAIDYWKDIPGFNRIPYKVGLQPNPGDIIVFNIGQFGHVCVCNWSRSFDFGGFEQNFPLKSVCHFQDHPNYNGVLGWLRPTVTGDSVPFVMRYVVYNGNQVLMEQARQLMKTYSNNLIDVAFNYSTIPPIVVSGLLTSDQQAQFISTHPSANPFVFLSYTSVNTPNYDYMSTNEVPGGSQKIMTIQEGSATAFNICYEMTHAMQMYCRQKGYSQSIDDVNTPDEAFLLKKLAQVLPLIGKI